MLCMLEDDPDFAYHVMWTEEAQINRDGIVNTTCIIGVITILTGCLKPRSCRFRSGNWPGSESDAQCRPIRH